MNLYKFNKVNITTNKAHISNIIYFYKFYYYKDINKFTVDLINDFLVDKPIKITHALIQFNSIHPSRDKTNALYWTDKKIGLHIRNSVNPFDESKENLFYTISGAEHNVPYSKININKIVNANNNFSFTIALSSDYTSHKPDDIILTNTPNSEITTGELPFNYVYFKLYYNSIHE